MLDSVGMQRTRDKGTEGNVYSSIVTDASPRVTGISKHRTDVRLLRRSVLPMRNGSKVQPPTCLIVLDVRIMVCTM